MADIAAVTARLEAVAARLEAAAGRMGAPAAGGGGGDAKPPALVDYEALYASHVQPFVDTCKAIQGLDEVAADTETAFGFLKEVFLAQSKCKKPKQSDLMKFVDPIVQVVTRAQSRPDKSHSVFEHEKAFSEVIQMMNFMFMPGPVSVVSATLEAADFYLIKILTKAKDMDDKAKTLHRNYVSQTKALVKEMAAYVKQHHLTGLIWNVKGGDLSSYKAGGGSSSGGAPGGAPPPPPPADPNVKLGQDQETKTAAPSSAGGMGAVFAEIAKKKDAAAAGLNRVTKDMKTKNLKDKPVVVPKKKAPAAAKKWGATKVTKPPSLALDRGTWFCEYYGEGLVEIPDAKMKQSVYISKCTNCTIKITGKVKSIMFDGCSKVKLFFDSVVSILEVVNCKRIGLYPQEQLPSITIDKSSGIQLWFSEEVMKAPPTVITSNVTEFNIVIPGATPEADPIELFVAEQFETRLVGGKVVTKPVEHHG